MCLLLSVRAVAAYSGGAGTETDPYRISSREDWHELTRSESDWSSHFLLTASLDFRGETVVPVAPDVDPNAVGFQGSTFTGVLDGAGHTIWRATISLPEQDYMGLIGCLGPGGRIHHLRVEEVDILGKSQVGGLLGGNGSHVIRGGEVTACSAGGRVSGWSSIGGLVGSNWQGRISACKASSSVGGKALGGGLVGYNDAGSVIVGCYATGAVDVELFGGGLVGGNMGSISICYATGGVSWRISMPGGLVAEDGGRIERCFWNANSSGLGLSAGGRGLTSKEMVTLSVFQNAGWAGHGWVMVDGLGYPRLAWEEPFWMPIPPADPVPVSGSGTAGDPYCIETPEELAQLSGYPDAFDKHFRVTNDLDMRGRKLHPIGDLKPFTGIFDGCGHAIRNVRKHSPEGYHIGLFGHLGPGGVVQDVHLEDVDVSGFVYVGGLVARSEGTLQDCHVSGQVSAVLYAGGLGGVSRETGAVRDCTASASVAVDHCGGGLVGENLGQIVGCQASGDVAGTSCTGGLVGANGAAGTISESTASAVLAGGEHVGGLVGENIGAIVACSRVVPVHGYRFVGGLVGDNRGTIRECHTAAEVTGGDTVGGLVGVNLEGGLICDCSATAAASSERGIVGGLAGANGEGVIETSYATGDVSSDGMWVGGLVGHHRGEIRSCHAAGDVTGDGSVGGLAGGGSGVTTNCRASGAVRGEDHVGGLLGRCNGAVIRESYATGTVDGNSRVGGLAGSCRMSTISDCYAEGAASGYDCVGGLTGFHDVQVRLASCRAYGNVTGTEAIGGLTGEHGPDSEISGCSAEGTASGETIVGGLVGTSRGRIDTSWASGNVEGQSACGGLLGENLGGEVVTSYSSAVVVGQSEVGGLVGRNSSGMVADCFACGSAAGDRHVGGLVGEDYGGTVKRCYATAATSGTFRCGGIVGRDIHANVESSFWDMDASGQESTYGGGVGLTTAEMWDLGRYLAAGWDFGEMGQWQAVDQWYPMLAWQTIIPTAMPDVTGQSEADARAALREAGLDIAARYMHSDTVAAGAVIEQWPVGGATAPAGARVLVCVSLGRKYGSGSGTADDPFGIGSAEELIRLGEFEEDYDGHFVLTADIDLGGYLFDRPVIAADAGPHPQDTGRPFSGVFNGNGHVISSLAITAERAWVGLFGCVSAEGRLENMWLEGVEVYGGEQVGGLFGVNKGHVSNCQVSGTVTGYEQVGGLGGMSTGVIESGHVTGSVLNIAGGNTIGGVCGKNFGTILDSSAAVCIGGGIIVGGLVGESRGLVIGCRAAGTVAGDRQTGGFVGYNCSGATVSGCYAETAVSGQMWVGGFVGTTAGHIAACYAVGPVTGESFVGGFVPAGDGQTDGCFWDVDASGQMSNGGPGKGLGTDLMRRLSVFRDAGWAGYGWVIADGIDYPRRAWEQTGGVAIPEAPGVPLLGGGTAADPYIVETAEDFGRLSWHVDALNGHFLLAADLDLAGHTLHPIGDLGAFRGVFDGNGHILRNVSLRMPGRGNVGLFGLVGPGGCVRNVVMQDAQIAGDSNVGGLAGQNYGALSECRVAGGIVGRENVGGLAGWSLGPDAMISKCYTNIYAAGPESARQLGGLAGRNGGSINNCGSAGEVAVGDHSEAVGGLLGENGGSVYGCYAQVRVQAGAGAWCTGGLVGRHDGAIDRCFSSGPVFGDQRVGGLCGEGRGARQSYATGSVRGTSHVGGLCGLSDGTIRDCYAAGRVCGDAFVGGLVGASDVSKVVQSFWDMESTGMPAGFPGWGKTTAEMMSRMTYRLAGWDFTEEDGDPADWVMLREGEDYPRLAWQEVFSGDVAGLYGVDGVDFAEVAVYWGAEGCGDGVDCEDADVDGDGAVGLGDLLILSSDWLAGG